MDMEHLQYPDKEATLIFSFAGTLENKMAENMDDFGHLWTALKNMTVENLDLIRKINEYEHQVPAGPKVSVSLVICNFMKNIIVVKDPHLTSGKLDSREPWPTYIEPSSVALLYSRKKSWDARGSVGLTVITVQYDLRLYSFAVHWHECFDFNLFENSFAVFPLPGQEYSSEDATKTFKDFIDYSNLGNIEEKYVGIRGFAKDGPKAIEYHGMLISVKMGVSHNDTMQLSILPLDHNHK